MQVEFSNYRDKNMSYGIILYFPFFLILKLSVLGISFRYKDSEADANYSAFHLVDGQNVSCKPIQVS